jgi:hypothetical protein
MKKRRRKNNAIESRMTPLRIPLERGYRLEGVWTFIQLSPESSAVLPELYRLNGKSLLFAYNNLKTNSGKAFKPIPLYLTKDEYGTIGYATDYVFSAEETPLFRINLYNEKKNSPHTWVFQTNLNRYKQSSYIIEE